MSLVRKNRSGKYWPGCEATLVRGGSDYFDLLESIIDSAQKTVYLQTYIFENDVTGKRVADALMRTARRGVEVYVLVDSFGSQNIPPQLKNTTEVVNLHFRYFMPIFSRKMFHFCRRLHHKVVVVDNQKALVGGLNI